MMDAMILAGLLGMGIGIIIVLDNFWER